MSTHSIQLRNAIYEDATALAELEYRAFTADRLSLRRFRHWIKADNRVFVVSEIDSKIVGYGLVLLHKGTRLARLYSLAVADEARGLGLGKILLSRLEQNAIEQHRLYMRLEVATDNSRAIGLYQSLGYVVFDRIDDYYEDHRDALRMQKCIRTASDNQLHRVTPWYRQTTEFTCGPAAIMMAMASLNPAVKMSQQRELDIWREATTIFMTSGHGGCHPIGLALSATQLGFDASVYINQRKTLFIDSVRNHKKKEILHIVDAQFRRRAKEHKIPVTHRDVSQSDIARWLSEGASVVMLISTYRIDEKKSPHWVTISGLDDECFYLHDPEPVDDKYIAFDCQYVPIARDDFAKMTSFGNDKLRTCVVLKPNKQKK